MSPVPSLNLQKIKSEQNIKSYNEIRVIANFEKELNRLKDNTNEEEANGPLSSVKLEKQLNCLIVAYS